MAVSEELLVKVSIDTAKGTVAIKDLTVSLNDLKNASQGVDKSTKETNKSTAESAQKFNSTALMAIGLNQALELMNKAYTVLIGTMRSSVLAFAAQDKAQKSLSLTLKSVGLDSKAAFNDLNRFASMLQKTAGVQDETTLSLAAMAKGIGLSNTQTKQIIQTSADLAAVMGTDVSSAFNELIGQYQGVTGRSAKYIVGLKDLNEWQLKTGEGIDLVTRQVKGLAAAQTESLAGAIHQTKFAFEDLLKSLGSTIVRLINLPEIMKQSIATLESMAHAIEIGGMRILAFKDNLAKLDFETVKLAAIELGVVLAAAFIGLNLTSVITSLGSLAAALTTASLAGLKLALISAAIAGVIVAVDTLLANLDRLNVIWDVIKKSFENMYQRLVRGFASIGIAALSVFSSLLERLAPFSDTAAEVLQSINQGIVSLGNTAEEADIKVSELNDSVIATAKNLNMGAILTTITDTADALNKALETTNVATKETNTSFKDTSRIMAENLKATKEQLTLLQQIKLENANLNVELSGFHSTEIEKLEKQFEIQKLQNTERLRQLAIEGKLGAESQNILKQIEEENKARGITGQNAENIGKDIIANLKQQLDLQRLITDEQIYRQAQSQIDQMNPIAAAVGTGALDLGKGLNEAIPAFNEMFGTNIGKMEASIIAGFAIGVADFFNSWKGFMKGSANIVGGAIIGAAKISDKLFGTSAEGTAKNVAGAFATAAGKVGSIFGYVAQAIAKLFDPEFIQGIADMLVNLVDKLPDMLVKAFNSLSDAFAKVIEKLPDLVGKLFASLGSIFDKLIAQFPALVDGLAEAAVTFLDKLPELTQRIFSALPSMIDKLLSAAPRIIDAIFKAIPAIITQLIQAVPGVIVAIIENIPAIVQSLIQGIIGAMGEIVAAFIDFLIGGGLEKIVVALVKAIPVLIKAIVNGIINGLKRALGAIFGGIKAPEFAKDMEKLPGKFAKGIKDLGKGVAKETSKLFKVLDLENAARATERLSQAKDVGDVIEVAMNVAGEAIKGLWQMFLDALKRLWMWIYDNIMKPIIDGLTAVWRWVYDNVLKPIIEGLTTIWRFVYDNIIGPLIDGLTAVWRFVYDNIVGPLIDGITAAWQWVYDTVIEPITSIISDAWNGIVDFFTNIFKGKIGEAFQDVIDTLKKIGSDIWEAIKNGFDSYKEKMKEFGTKIWEGLKSGIESVSNFFSNLGGKIWDGLKSGLGGFGKFIQDGLNAINPANLLQKMFKFDGGGKGGVESALSRISGQDIDVPWVAFAKGGLVPGRASVAGDSPINDRIVALLSPGEAVVPRSVMEDRTLSGLIQAIINGEFKPQGFALGGTLGKVVSGDFKGAASDVGGAVSSLDPAKLWEQFKEAAFKSLWDMVQNAKFHSGGAVPGFAFGGDVPALLQPGEYVMNRGAVNRLGGDFFAGLNAGGSVGGNTTINMDVKVSINASSQSLDETYVRTKLVPAIKEEFKKASLRGDFLISERGLRAT